MPPLIFFHAAAAALLRYAVHGHAITIFATLSCRLRRYATPLMFRYDYSARLFRHAILIAAICPPLH